MTNPERTITVDWHGESYPTCMDVYPHRTGDVLVLGPELFAGRNGDETVLCWRGENYTVQRPTLRVRLHNLVVRLKSRRDDDTA